MKYILSGFLVKFMKNIFKSNIFKSSIVLGAVAGIATGLGFGFSNYSAASFDPSEEYNTKLQTNLDVKRDPYSQTDINDVILDLHSALEWQGYIEADVKRISSNEILVTHELKYAQDNTNLWTYEAEQAILEEVIQLHSSLYTKTNIEFRTFDGQQLFQLNSEGHPEFIPPTPPDTGEGESRDYDVPEYDVSLIAEEGAEVVLEDGNPAIELTPVDVHVLNEFKHMMNFMFDSMDPEANPNGNTFVTWIGYDLFGEVAQALDPDGWAAAPSPIDYAFTDEDGNRTDKPIKLAEPFLISIDQASPMLDWEDTFKIGNGINSETAERFASRINFSTTDYEFDVVSTSMLEPSENSVRLLWMMILFLTVIAITLFTFTWFFGLLGLINSLLTSTTVLGVFGMIVSMSIPVSPSLFALLAIGMAMTILFSWNSLTKQKNALNKSENFAVAIKSTMNSLVKSNTVSFGILMILSVFIGLFSSMAAGLPSWIILFTMILSYIVQTYASPLISIAVNKWFGKQEMDKGYNFVTGTPIKKKYRREGSRLTIDRLSTAKNAKIGMLSGVGLALVGSIIFGALFGITGQGVNNQQEFRSSYNYEIVMRANFKEVIERTVNFDDPQGQQGFIDQVEKDIDTIINILENNGLTVSSHKTQKNSNYGLDTLFIPGGQPEDRLNIIFTYGIVVNSPTEMTEQMANDINDDLVLIDTDQGESLATYDAGDYNGVPYDANEWTSEYDNGLLSNAIDGNEGYIINESYSSINLTDGAKILNQTTNIEVFNKQIIAIVVATVIAMMFIFIFLNWTGFVTIGGSMMIETLAAFGLFPILFLPFGSTFLIGLIATIVMSLISKSIFMQDARSNILKTGKIKESVFSSVANNKRKTFWINLTITVLIGITSIMAGASMMPALAMTLIGFAFVELSNTLIFPRITTMVERFNREKKYQMHQNDMARVKDPETIEEEYIKGINY